MKTTTKPSAAVTTQHTPGPWSVVIDNDSRDPIRIFQDDGTGNGDHIRMIDGDPESMANARLIAAAPEMLAALQMVRLPDVHTTAREAIRAAIATAAGLIR